VAEVASVPGVEVAGDDTVVEFIEDAEIAEARE
jgi:hypothetical protein